MNENYAIFVGGDWRGLIADILPLDDACKTALAMSKKSEYFNVMIEVIGEHSGHRHSIYMNGIQYNRNKGK